MQTHSHAGFSNPFDISQTQFIKQGGYTGFQSFAPPQQTYTQMPRPQQPPLQPPLSNTTIQKKSIRQSKIAASTDRNPQKRKFKGKYELDATIPVKYNTVDYFMLVENVRINNETALRDLKRGKASDILDKVLDSLEFLSYVHK